MGTDERSQVKPDTGIFKSVRALRHKYNNKIVDEVKQAKANRDIQAMQGKGI